MSANILLQRLLVLYGPPESPDDAAFVEEYQDMLAGTEQHVLKMAGDFIRDTHARRGWPTPAEVKAAVAKAAGRFAAAREPILTEEDFEWVGPPDERYTAALTQARTDAPTYAAMIERRGKIKVRKETAGPRKADVRAVITDLSKRMSGERD